VTENFTAKHTEDKSIPEYKKNNLETKAFCSVFSELGLLTITGKVRSVQFERQRRKLHI
jgi:hypothetical protein